MRNNKISGTRLEEFSIIRIYRQEKKKKKTELIISRK